MPELRDPDAPYPGLRPFEATEAEVFFGREAHTDRLLDILQRERFLAVIGPSGSGKSSLVRAGLLPALHRGSLGSGSDWRIAVLRPGDQPIRSLASALLQPDVLGPDLGADPQDLAPQVALLAAELRRGPLGLLHATEIARAPGLNLLILVDQFEELFTYAEADGERADESEAFVNLLLAARADATARVHVALTMRTDFLGNCVRFAELPDAINRAQYLTPRLTRDQMAAAIAGPAEVFGGSVDDSLVAELINAVGQNSDQLPLLQHALSRMWLRAVARNPQAPRIGWDDVNAIGGLSGALDQHAESVLDGLTRGPGAAGSLRAVEALFCAITERRAGAAGGQDVRRPRTLARIAAACDLPWQALAPVVSAFAAPDVCLVQHGRALGPDSVIDLSHEALMRQWKRLTGWVALEARRGNDYRRWAERASEHAQGRSDLLEGATLARALEWREGADAADTSAHKSHTQNPAQAQTASWQPTAAWAERYALGDDPHEEFALTLAFVEASAQQAQRRIDNQRQADERTRREATERAEAAEQSARKSRRMTQVIGASALALLVMAGFAWQAAERATAAEANVRTALLKAQAAEAEATQLRADAEALARKWNAQLKIADDLSRSKSSYGSSQARTLSLQDLAEIMPASKPETRELYLAALKQAMADFGINTTRRQAHFLAQVSFETTDLRYVQEPWTGSPKQMRYEPPSSLASSLGNVSPGDGERYRGRGLFQLVGRANYKRYGDALGLDLVARPELAAEPDGAARTAAIFWKLRGMNELADGDDLNGITRRVSGGLNGLEARQRALTRARQVLERP